jgi:hypothetical protein
MADAAKLPSLTVLSGPQAGTRFVIEDAVDNILIGSDPSCRFCLDTPGVSPIHARLWIDLSGLIVHDTNSPHGVYVNDDRVDSPAPLRNGDILWLGRPGDEMSTMLQCRLPIRAAEQPAIAVAPPPAFDPDANPSATIAFMSPSHTAAIDAVDADETATLRAAEETVEPGLEPAPVPDRDDLVEHDAHLEHQPLDEGVEPTVIAAPEELGDGAPAEVEPEVEPELEPELEPEMEPTIAARPAPFPDPEEAGIPVADETVSEPLFEDDVTHAMRVPVAAVPEPTVAMVPPAADPDDAMRFELDNPPRFSAAPVHTFEEDIDETLTVAQPDELEPTVAQPPPRPPAPAPPAPPAAAPPRAPVPTKPAPTATPRPTPTPRPASAPRVPAPRPAASAEAAAPPPSPPAARPSAGGGRGALWAVGALVLVALGGAAYYFLKPASTSIPPISQAQATPPPGAGTATPAPVDVAPVTPDPAPTPVVEEEVTIVPGATPRPVPSPVPAPSLRPGAPSPVTTARPGTSPPVTNLPAQPPPAAARVAGLLSQAQGAYAGGNYDAAIAGYDEALKLEPQNASAQSGRAAAVSARLASRKSFVTGRTVVQAGKAKANLSGFDTSDVSVQKAPDFSGRLEFSMSPSKPRPGEGYRLQIALVNDGKKAIKLSAMTVSTLVNGSRTGGPMAPRVREVAPQQRAVLEELPGVWPADVTSWSAEVNVTAGKNESLKGQVSWR